MTGSNYTGFRLNSGSHLTRSPVDRPVAGNGEPRGHPLQPDRAQPDRDRGRHDRPQHLPARQLHGGRGRTAEPGGRLAVRGRGGRPVRQRVLTARPGTPLRLERPRWCRQRIGVGVLGRRGRCAGSDRGIPHADGQTAPCWVETSHDGRFLFTVNTGSTTISSYGIQADGSLAHLSDTAFASGLGIRPFDARLDVDGSNLYVVDAAIDAVSAFSVDGGSLSELTSSPASLPAGATPFGIVVTKA